MNIPPVPFMLPISLLLNLSLVLPYKIYEYLVVRNMKERLKERGYPARGKMNASFDRADGLPRVPLFSQQQPINSHYVALGLCLKK